MNFSAHFTSFITCNFLTILNEWMCTHTHTLKDRCLKKCWNYSVYLTRERRRSRFRRKSTNIEKLWIHMQISRMRFYTPNLCVCVCESILCKIPVDIIVNPCAIGCFCHVTAATIYQQIIIEMLMMLMTMLRPNALRCLLKCYNRLIYCQVKFCFYLFSLSLWRKCAP